MKKPDDGAIPPIPKVERGDSTILPQEQLTSPAQASFEFICTSVEEAIFWDCSIIFATASKMSERLRSQHLIKLATCAEKKQHGRRRAARMAGSSVVRDELSLVWSHGVRKRSEVYLGKYEESKNERPSASPS